MNQEMLVMFCRISTVIFLKVNCTTKQKEKIKDSCSNAMFRLPNGKFLISKHCVVALRFTQLDMTEEEPLVSYRFWDDLLDRSLWKKLKPLKQNLLKIFNRINH